jgi:hypothetical protein
MNDQKLQLVFELTVLLEKQANFLLCAINELNQSFAAPNPDVTGASEQARAFGPQMSDLRDKYNQICPA